MISKTKPSAENFWRVPAYLKGIRESFDPPLSQHELARKSGVTRAVIANCETGVTPLTPKNGLVIYMILEAFGSKEAGRAVRAINAVLKRAKQRELAVVEAELSVLQKRQQQLLGAAYEAKRKGQAEAATSAALTDVWKAVLSWIEVRESVPSAEAELEKDLEKHIRNQIYPHINQLVTQRNYWEELAHSQALVIAELEQRARAVAKAK